MVRISDLVLAAEAAPQSALEKALDVLRGNLPQEEEFISAVEAAKACRVHVETIYRRAKPADRLGGKNWYRLSEVKEALR
jgi:hypothetical protein